MDDDQVMHAMSLDDMYHVERVLAHGNGGVTELVTIEGSGPFVRKKIPLERANRSVWSACADCGCQRLPHVEAMYELPDEFVVVYDFVPGDSLDRLVRSNGPLSQERAVGLARDLCEAAGALHAHGVIHRDISPNNVIVSGDGAHLIDLDIARMYEDGASHDGDALGTWGYASPEQYGFAQTDPRSDTYSIGRLLAYMVTGVPPADEGFDAALANGEVVSPQLRAVIARATAFEPSARYQSAGELSAALAGLASPSANAPSATEATAGGRGVYQEGPRRAGRSHRSARPGGHPRRSVLALACAGAAAAVAAALVALAFGGGQGGSEPANNAGAPTQAVAANAGSEDGALEAGDVEWSVTPNGSVIFLVSLANASETLTAELPSAKVTGTDAQGNVTFSRDEYFMVAYPGQTVTMADLVLDAASTTSVSASVNPSSKAPRQLPRDQQMDIRAENVRLSTDGLGQPKVTGLISRGRDGEEDASTVRVDVAFRDDAGKLVGMGEAYPSAPAAGGSTSFEATATESYGKAVTVDVYVNPWG